MCLLCLPSLEIIDTKRERNEVGNRWISKKFKEKNNNEENNCYTDEKKNGGQMMDRKQWMDRWQLLDR